ncbi:protein-glutamine gamma-glutamyltransferase K-like isoform X2 [Mya arenaria]|nr:protein-glutamine gamma-glutamyltransferase K-like isoform X2 [Mya arenaria]
MACRTPDRVRRNHHILPVSLSEKFASYYGNLRGLLLGSNLAGRRAANYQDTLFPDDAQLTAFKKDKDGKEDGQLKPRSVDFFRMKNRTAHRTSDYEIPNLIIRRGHQFDMSITFDRPFSCQDDELTLKFVTGRQPLQSKGTVVTVSRIPALREPIWAYQLVRVEDKVVHLKVGTTPEAIVGRYNLFIETTHRNEQGEVEKYRYAQPDDIYLLFNPWCTDDQVYIEDENQRQEYVLSETGRIWLGTVGKFCVRPWNFGQFDDVCLVAAIAIMEKSELGDQARGNPVYVLRALSRVINNNERDGGVLVGNWSGKYEDGVAPSNWNGSTAILEEFLKKRKGVKFGQCWTFAAVATTVFRALGIPTRCVTSFKAAHDSDYSSPMVSHWSTEGKPKTAMSDSVWDFHVWNESWCRRMDLPPGYDGWQAYDTTPQECLEGVFTCGPASVKAVKQGEIFYGYDAKFIFAEVNGDRTHWTVDHEGNMRPVAVEKNMMGRFISTKAVNTISREDLTYAYKFQEDSDDRDVTLELARKLSTRRTTEIDPCDAEDVEFDISADMQRNGDFSIALRVTNAASVPRTVDMHLNALSCRYTGIANSDLKDSSSSSVLEPKESQEVCLSMKCADYIGSVDSDSHVNAYVTAHVRETSQRFVFQEPLWIEKPHIEIKTEGSAHVGKSFDVVVKLVNPLTVPLTGCHLNIEGPGMQRISSIKVKKPIAPGEELRETIQMKPRRLGRKEIIVNFQCKQLSDVTGVIELDVVEDSKS